MTHTLTSLSTLSDEGCHAGITIFPLHELSNHRGRFPRVFPLPLHMGTSRDIGGVRSLSWWRLGAIAFVMTSCGPFGVEACVSNGGALLTLIAIFVVPVLYVVPQVLMVSELALMMPSMHGHIRWVEEGWGPFAGFFNAYNAILVNTIDLALYPVLASEYAYIHFFAPTGGGGSVGIPGGRDSSNPSSNPKPMMVLVAIRLLLIFVGTLIAITSARHVSDASIGMAVMIVVPFLGLFLLLAPRMDPASQWTVASGAEWGGWSNVTAAVQAAATVIGPTTMRETLVATTIQPLTTAAAVTLSAPSNSWNAVEWGAFTASALWLYTGWNSLGALAGEVEQPSHGGVSNVFTRGLSFALFLSIAMYFLPVTAALTIPGQWYDGYLSDAFDRALPGAGVFVSCLGVTSQLGLFCASLVCYSRMVWGMAELGWLPKYLAKLSDEAKTPDRTTLLQAVVLLPLMLFDFSFLQRLEFTLAAISYILTFTAFLRMRYTQPEHPRPFTVPGGKPFAWLITMTKVVVMSAVALSNALDPLLLGVGVGINGGIALAYYATAARNVAPIAEGTETEGAAVELRDVAADVQPSVAAAAVPAASLMLREEPRSALIEESLAMAVVVTPSP